MKAVGNNPLARYVGQETGARPPPTPTTPPRTQDQPAGEPGEPTSLAQINRTKPLDFVSIGWSPRPLRAPAGHRDHAVSGRVNNVDAALGAPTRIACGISAISSTEACRRSNASAGATVASVTQYPNPGRAPLRIEAAVGLGRHALQLDAQPLGLTVGLALTSLAFRSYRL